MSEKLAFYIRLSNEDFEKGIYDESMSVQNQRDLLQSTYNERDDLHGYDIVEYVDDGYTGTNFNRPGFQRMLSEVKKGRIKCIMVKDFSRYARNYLDAGEYLEQIFPFMGVRFISVNDGYDSKYRAGRAGEWDVVFKNYLYDMYSRDLSKKVRSAKLTKAKHGEYLGRAPMGYVRSKTVKNHLEVEPEGAAVIRRIYDQALSGMSVSDIVRQLNEEGIPTPSVFYERANGKSRLFEGRSRKIRFWSVVMVHKILTNPVYTGACVNCKRSKVAVGSRQTRAVEKEDWIIVPDCHEAIVTRQEFDLLESRRRSLKGREAKSKYSRKHMLNGYVVCGYCGRRMYFYRRNTIPSYYQCAATKYVRDTGMSDEVCDGTHYTVDDIEAAILSGVRKLGKLADEELLKEKLGRKEKRGQIADCRIVGMDTGFCVGKEHRARGLPPDLNRLEHRLAECKEEKVAIYEQYATRDMDRDTYLKRKQELDAMIRELTEEGERLREEKERAALKESDDRERREKLDVIRSFLGCEEVSRELLEALVEKVVVFRGGRYEIVWKCGDLNLRGEE